MRRTPTANRFTPITLSTGYFYPRPPRGGRHFQITGQGDFTGEDFDIVFNMDLPVNETDVINNARTSDGLISKRTILQNHPWVTDVDEELDQIDKEKKAAMEDFGEGLFNDSLGANNAAQTAQEGQEGAAGKAGGVNGEE